MMEKPKRGDISPSAPSKCPGCGGSQFERGLIQMQGGYQKLDENGNMPIFARPKALAAFRCENCNRVEFYTDSEITKIARRQQTHVVFVVLGIIALIYAVLGIIFLIIR
jgi:predicted nucleic-acid-binding Zn-ribbon protein